MAAPENNRNAAHGEVIYTTRIQVWMTDDDKAANTAMAKSQGMKLSALVRLLLRRERDRINGGQKGE